MCWINSDHVVSDTETLFVYFPEKFIVVTCEHSSVSFLELPVVN